MKPFCVAFSTAAPLCARPLAQPRAVSSLAGVHGEPFNTARAARKTRSFVHTQTDRNAYAPCRRGVCMLGPFFPNLGDSKLLKSEVVRKELMALEADYMELAKLGQQYQKFDRQGKLVYIDRALDVVDRFSIFLTRMKLSEDFSSQMFVKQYQLKLGEFGFTIESLVANTKQSLEAMRSEVPEN